jgi:MFS family permease
VVLLLGVPGQLIGGRLAETGPRRLALRYAALYGGAVLAGLSVRAAGPTPLGVALAGLFSLLIFLGQPITNQLVARSTRAGRRGAAYGTYFSLSFGVGALAGRPAGWWPTGPGSPPCSASWGWSPSSTPSAGWPCGPCSAPSRQGGPRRPSVWSVGQRIDRSGGMSTWPWPTARRTRSGRDR